MKELAVLTTYYNFCNYQSIKDNYRIFSESIDKLGIPLYTAEVILNSSSAPQALAGNIYRYETGSYIWYKENLINILIKKLPPEIKYVAWVDSDILFDNPNWPEELCGTLEEYPVVQPFTTSVRLDKRGNLNSVGTSVPYWLKYKDSEEVAPLSRGFAWAARREIIEKYLLHDKHIMGGGDSFFIFALYGWWEDQLIKGDLYPKGLVDDFLEFAIPLHEEIKGNVGYIPGNIRHLWHGERSNRNYWERIYMLKVCEFDPRSDLIYRPDGLLEWKDKDGLLQKSVEFYFKNRKEDG
jgi:hypothetical protein